MQPQVKSMLPIAIASTELLFRSNLQTSTPSTRLREFTGLPSQLEMSGIPVAVLKAHRRSWFDGNLLTDGRLRSRSHSECNQASPAKLKQAWGQIGNRAKHDPGSRPIKPHHIKKRGRIDVIGRCLTGDCGIQSNRHARDQAPPKNPQMPTSKTPRGYSRLPLASETVANPSDHPRAPGTVTHGGLPFQGFETSIHPSLSHRRGVPPLAPT